MFYGDFQVVGRLAVSKKCCWGFERRLPKGLGEKINSKVSCQDTYLSKKVSKSRDAVASLGLAVVAAAPGKS